MDDFGIGSGCAGHRGCNCGCKTCQHYAWDSFMRAVLDSQGLGHHPACSVVQGLATVQCADVPDVLQVVVAQRPAVKRGPCDRRGNCNPTPGPTGWDERCAGCWWVSQVVPQGVGVMDGISFDGRPVQGFAGSPFGHYPYDPLRPAHPLEREPVAQQAKRNLFLAAPPGLQQLGLGATAATATNPSTVGLVAALGGAVGLIAGGALGSEIGTGTGEQAVRRAAVGGLLGMLVGSFAGAAITAPSTAAQTGA